MRFEIIHGKTVIVILTYFQTEGFKMTTITMNRITYTRKLGTKDAWIETENKTENFTREQYDNFINAAPFYRRFGGSETLQREYTCAGYLVTKNISKSPDRNIKKITTFTFKYTGN